MTDYTDCLKKAKLLHKQLVLLDELVLTIDDPVGRDVMTLRTLMPRMVAKSEHYVKDLQERRRKSNAMKKRKKVGS